MEIHVEVWLATAHLHEAGQVSVSPTQIHDEVKRIFGAARAGVITHVVSHVNASAKKATGTPYCYVIREGRGTYRLCRAVDAVHPSRVGMPLNPEQEDIPERFWPLWRKWTAWQRATAKAAAQTTAAAQMPLQNRAGPAQLAAYVRSLPDFRMERTAAVHYDHMGAIITEAILQAGIDYRNVVLPRVNALRQTHPEARTTSRFEALLRMKGADVLLDFSGEKPRRVAALTRFLLQERVETEADLRIWLANSGNRVRLQDLPGVGPKTVDYLQILVGIDNSAVDRHLSLFLEHAGVQAATYHGRKEIIEAAAQMLGVDKAVLDYSIWLYMSDRSRNSSVPAESGRPWHWEGNVQAMVVAHLQSKGYTIVRVANTESREAGKDIIARSAGGQLLWVSVKGFPEKSANTQARHWFAGAMFDLLLYHGENANVDLALGLPDGYQTYRGLSERVAWLRQVMPFTIYWVSESGAVLEG